jgi:hypothetical protein
VQRNTKEEGGEIKNGGSPASFGENPHVKSQKDVNARWTKKNNMVYLGIKTI